ncbi:S-layer homology domain-containing protein [Cohnella cellulosilytica]|uniref:S-layer homology domain-containing protein n=1 Tax=Cohnella cellulosilytica TaxID=986710 RepID=A0ABW2FIC2_9BACL
MRLRSSIRRFTLLGLAMLLAIPAIAAGADSANAARAVSIEGLSGEADSGNALRVASIADPLSVTESTYAPRLISLADSLNVVETGTWFEDDYDHYPVGPLPLDGYDSAPSGFSVAETEAGSGNHMLLATGNSGKLFKSGNWTNSALTFDYKFNDPLNNSDYGLFASAYSTAPDENESKVYLSLHPYTDRGANFSVQEYVNGGYKRHASGEMTMEIGKWYKAEAVWYEGIYYFKTWPSGEPEPEQWNLVTAASFLPYGGGLNLEYYGGADHVSAAFDNVKVSSIEPQEEIPDNSDAVQAELYVSPSGNDGEDGSELHPFRTLRRAQEAVRAINSDMTGDIIVYLRGGVFPVNDTWTLTAQDSGTNGYRIVYKAYPGEKPVLSGAKEIAGWSPLGDGSGIWAAAVPDVRDTRQFYINGKKGVLARGDEIKVEGWSTVNDPDMARHNLVETFTGYQGSLPVYSQYATSAKYREMAGWRNPDQIEFVYDVAWTHSVIPVDGIAADPHGDGVIITMRNPAFRDVQIKDGVQVEDPSYIQNAYELLDEPGEWYFDRTGRTLYYMPRAGEEMRTAQAIVPVVEQLMTLEGTLDAPVHHISFENLAFEHTTPLRTSEEGHVEIQANIVKDPGIDLHHTSYMKVPSGISLSAAQHISFERNQFQLFGAGVIDIDNGSSDNRIRGSVFREIAGGGVQIGGFQLEDAHPDDERKIVKNNVVTNNFFNKIGTDFKGSVAIFAGYTEGTTITHNEIYDTSYSGISVGWGWGFFDENGRTDRAADDLPRYDNPTAAKANIIRNNYIHKVMQQLHDGAAIYTLSMMEGSLIEGNWIHDVPGWPGGIYLDEGTGGFTLRNNLIYDVSKPYHYNDVGMVGRQETNQIQTNYFGIAPDNPSFPTHVAANAGIQPAYLEGMPALIAAASDFARAGEVLTIPGKRFGASAGTVAFAGKDASVIAQGGDIVSWTPERIRVRVPSAAVSGLVYVTTADGGVSDKQFQLTVVPDTTLLFEAGFDDLDQGALPDGLFSAAPSGFSVVETDAASGAKALQASGSSGKLFKEANWTDSQLTFDFKFNDAMTGQYHGIYVSQLSETPGGNENKVYFSIHPNEANENVLVQQNINGYTRHATLKQEIAIGAWYSVKSALIDHKLYLNIWPADQPEPELWQSVSEVGTLSNGGGLNLELASAAGKTVLFDNLKVETWDRTAPITAAIASGEEHNGWYSSDPTITLTAEDDLDGVVRTEYRILEISSGEEESSNFVPYTGPFTLGEGVHEVVYRSTDASGNREADKRLEVKVDKTAPLIAVTTQGSVLAPNQTLANHSQLRLDIEIRDGLSGMGEARITFDGTLRDSGEAIALAGKIGNHELLIEAVDRAGNAAAVRYAFTVKSAGNGGGTGTGGDTSGGTGTGGSTGNEAPEANGGTEPEEHEHGEQPGPGAQPDSGGQPEEAAKLKDVSSHWSSEYVAEAIALGFVQGFGDGTFRPNQAVTRLELVTMLARALGLKSEGAAQPFADSGRILAWGKPFVEAAVEAGLLSGYEDHTFRPERTTTRAEAAAILFKLILPDAGTVSSSTGFADDDQIPAWAKPYIAAAKAAGLLQGKGRNRFAPQDQLTRAEAVVMILNLIHSIRDHDAKV